VSKARHYLIQTLLPLYDNDGRAFGEEPFAATRTELTERFGGLTAHLRAPARGLWKKDDGQVQRDDVVIFEVMTDALDRPWWKEYRATLEARFAQEAIVVRATRVRLL
jgi:C4-dicarboxylate-specific signal transduction histidine kinase